MTIPAAAPLTSETAPRQRAAAVAPADTRVACPSCDLLFDVGGLKDGETARCSRCGHFLTTRRDDAYERITAFCIAGLVMMSVACAFPFLQFSRAGLENTMTLPQTVIELWNNGMPWLALIVAAFILVVPVLVMVGMLVMAVVISNERHPPWLRQLGSLIFHLQNWSMVEVFFVGVLVSLVKIAAMATIVLGLSFWAYAVFSILFTLAMTSLDKYQCWQRIEALSES